MLSNQDINYSLLSAVREGRIERTRELINTFGLSYSKAWSEGYILLCDAVKSKHAAVAKLLLTSGSKVNKKSKRPSNTPLHFAAINGDMEIIKMILHKHANIDARNQYGKTPLHNAIENNKVEVTELLLQHGAYVHAKDSYGKRPLHLAVEMGHLQIVEHLLKYGSCPNSTSTLKNGYAPLHFAVEKGNTEAITLLLSKGAKVDIPGKNNITPLHIAAKKGYINIAERLLNYGASIHSLTLKEEYTPLHFAVEQGNEEAVKVYLSRGADINARTKGMLSPLYTATKRGHRTIVKLLLQNGAKVGCQINNIKRIQDLAVEKGCVMSSKDVLGLCHDYNIESKKRYLKNAVNSKGEKYKKIIESFLEYGLIVNPEDANNAELLHIAVEKGHLKIVRDLLKYAADANTLHNSTSKEGFNLLHSAVLNSWYVIAKLLISYGVDINAQDKTGKTPILYAIEKGDSSITKLLLNNGATVKDYPQILNMAVVKGRIEIVKVLFHHGVDINASDKYGRTALHFTAFSESEILCEYKIRPTNFTIIFFDDPYSKIKIVKFLLSKGANVNAKQKDGTTTLHIATQSRNEMVLKELLQCGANVDSKINGNITPLHLGAKKGYQDIIETILKFGADISSRDKYGRTALHVASQEGHVKAVEILLEYGADISSRDKYGRTALHVASQEGHVKAVEILLEYGADINVVSINNLTPLDHATLGITTLSGQFNTYTSNDHYYYRSIPHYYNSTTDYYRKLSAEQLKRHIVQMKAANLYVSVKNVQSVSSNETLRDFQEKCEHEVTRMNSENINNTTISFCDILKRRSSLEIYMRNENIVQVLNTGNYKTKFPIYASMIESHFRKGTQRKLLLERSTTVFNFLFNSFPEIPLDCIEKIFSYLCDKDLIVLIGTCKHNLSKPNIY